MNTIKSAKFLLSMALAAVSLIPAASAQSSEIVAGRIVRVTGENIYIVNKKLGVSRSVVVTEATKIEGPDAEKVLREGMRIRLVVGDDGQTAKSLKILPPRSGDGE